MLVSMMYQVLPKDWFTVDNQGFHCELGLGQAPPKKCTHVQLPNTSLEQWNVCIWGPQA